jgi:hypothetical protein
LTADLRVGVAAIKLRYRPAEADGNIIIIIDVIIYHLYYYFRSGPPDFNYLFGEDLNCFNLGEEIDSTAAAIKERSVISSNL